MARIGNHEIKITKTRLAFAAVVIGAIAFSGSNGQGHDSPPGSSTAQGLPGLVKAVKNLPKADIMPGCGTRTESEQAELKKILGDLGLQPTTFVVNPIDSEPAEPGIDTYYTNNDDYTAFAAIHDGTCYVDLYTGQATPVSVNEVPIPAHLGTQNNYTLA